VRFLWFGNEIEIGLSDVAISDDEFVVRLRYCSVPSLFMGVGRYADYVTHFPLPSISGTPRDQETPKLRLRDSFCHLSFVL
jgi:hypothetical protein